ncbi:MAG: hypothetical protein CL609_19095 [Anaerolineaceae bacterium]|nr:hypothetical protein [Anaerolineaceae bacterium]
MKNKNLSLDIIPFQKILLIILIFFSLVKIFVVPLELLRGFGDITHFYQLAQIPGLPFIDYWVEFPPIPVYLFELFYWVGKEDFQKFSILFLFFISLVNVGNFYLVSIILNQIEPIKTQHRKNIIFFYLIVMLFLPYNWWYFDGLTLLFLLLGMSQFLNKKFFMSVVFISFGVLTKLFPFLFFVVFIKQKIDWKILIKSIILIVLIVGLPYLLFFVLSPEMTRASLVSQAMKGSWETIWALIDGNYHTGNFGPLWERLDPSTAFNQIGNTSLIDPKITFIFFGLLGLIGIWRKTIHRPRQVTQLVLFTFCIFFIWSVGWSPQWVLYVIPFLLFSIPDHRIGLLISVIFILVNFFEWPIIIGFQWLNLLPITILIRTIGFILLAIYLYRKMADVQKNAG